MIGLSIFNEVEHNFRKKFPRCFTLASLFIIVLSCKLSATASSKYISSIKDGHDSSNTHQQPQSAVEDNYKTENVLKEPVPEDEITNILGYDDFYSMNCGKDCENDFLNKQITGTSGKQKIKVHHFGPIAYGFLKNLVDLVTSAMSFLYDFEPYLMQGSNKELDEAYCHNDDLNARFDCLKNNLLVVLRSLNMQQSLKLFEGIQLDHHRVNKTSETERSFDSDIWNTITSFFNSRVLSISVSKFVEGLMPTSVTKARILEYEDSLQHLFESIFEEKDTDSSESRKKKKKKFKKAIMIAIMTKAAIAAKAVLAGVVILAKKALMVSIISLVLSLIAAKKKKSGGKGDDHRRTDYLSDYIEWD